MKYWLLKTEPDVFSLEDLKNCPNQTENWDGIRNYQARNLMRDEMQVGDRAFFYHSRQAEPAIVGTVKVVREAYPDHTSWNLTSKYFDEKSSPENPRWLMVDVQFEKEFLRPVTLKELRSIPELKEMFLLRKGMRLSVQPVTKEEFQLILSLAND
ncbi:MAG: EVE domain-containing protein [Deltaproteobacteria bacterium]|jgi:predicted RNA-binding protein with PUA-like domain|nr:EVE domain-containing protein [Deltaproteobacteria bacterium]